MVIALLINAAATETAFGFTYCRTYYCNKEHIIKTITMHVNFNVFQSGMGESCAVFTGQTDLHTYWQILYLCHFALCLSWLG